jgi:major membrane immunogen (membrane-anchored lipoprotein)
MTVREFRPIRRSCSKKQDPARVDCISGATWSYNIFSAASEEALKNAKK